MRNAYLEIATTPAVRAARERHDEANRYAGAEGALVNQRLGPTEAAFIAARDSFYLASVSEDGWPYMQHRGGPVGVLRVIDETTVGFADYRGNKQYITVGNTSVNSRVSIFLMDYARKRRLKVYGTLDITTDAAFLAQVSTDRYGAVIERGMRIRIAAFDWNCPQHITPRFTEAEVRQASLPLHERIAALEAEVAALRAAPG